jgi:hypothetical protein
VAGLLLKKSIPVIDASHIAILAKHPELLANAVHIPRLASSALPLFVENIDKLPKTFWQEFDPNSKPKFALTEEEAIDVLPELLKLCHGRTKRQLQEKIVMSLFELVNDDRAIAIIKDHISLILADDRVGGTDVISELAKSSAYLAFEILTLINGVARNVEKQGTVRKCEQWISDCCGNNEVPVDLISQTIYALLDRQYPATASGKKKAEAGLGWAQKLMKKIGREIPRDMFGELADRVIACGSRTAANILRQISNAKIEN